jgi:threonine/homoserine/homoserine lactone efflux protein
MTPDLPAFALAVLVIAATPGPAVLLIVRRASLDGARAALATIAGLELGILIWAAAAASGLTALALAIPASLQALRIVGAVVLALLGIRALVGAWRLRAGGEEVSLAPTPRGRARFVEALLVQLSNPKAAVFMLAFFPQFIPPGADVAPTTALLVVVQIAVETVLFVAIALLAGLARGLLARPKVRRGMETLSGVVLIALAGRLAVSKL